MYSLVDLLEISFGDSAKFIVEDYCANPEMKLKQAASELNLLKAQITDSEARDDFMHQIRITISQFTAKNHLPGQAEKSVAIATQRFCRLHEAMLKGDKSFDGTRKFGIPSDDTNARAMEILQ